MAIRIPHKAFLSFSFKQCTNAFLRIAIQIDQHWGNENSREESLTHLKKNLETTLEHDNKDIQQLAQELLEIFPTDQKLMTFFLMKLERIDNVDIRENEFLVTWKDTPNKKLEAKHSIHLILDNLRSSFNVGGIFRTAESFGAEFIHLCGYTPTPQNSKVAKSSLGCENWIQWKQWESTIDCINFLKEKKFHIYALETSQIAQNIQETSKVFPCAFIFGNERYGISEHILERSDDILKIELSGKKNSLNVAVSTAITLYNFTSSN